MEVGVKLPMKGKLRFSKASIVFEVSLRLLPKCCYILQSLQTTVATITKRFMLAMFATT